MGIQIEFNPDLALRAPGTPGRMEEECIPERLEVGETYKFMKKGQRFYWFDGEVPLLETKGKGRLSRPLAAIEILEATHVKFHDGVWTRGLYKVIEVYDPKSPEVHFEGMNKTRGKKE